jgi:uncharacterized protein
MTQINLKLADAACRPAQRREATLSRCAASWLLAAAVCAGVTPAGAQADQPQSLPMTTLTAGMHKIQAQLAVSPQQRQTGLMFRREMPTQEGMLFVFEQASAQCFWMRNTLIPLSIAFLADDGTVVNIEDMSPQSDDSHCSAKPVRFVLEMNRGWFAKRGIKPGMRIGGAPFKP